MWMRCTKADGEMGFFSARINSQARNQSSNEKVAAREKLAKQACKEQTEFRLEVEHRLLTAGRSLLLPWSAHSVPLGFTHSCPYIPMWAERIVWFDCALL